MTERRLMKNSLGSDAIRRISVALLAVMNDFPAPQFIEEAEAGITRLELKQRVSFLIVVLARYLPADFTVTAAMLLQINDHWDFGEQTDSLSGFAAWPLIDYVAEYGMEHPQQSLAVLKQLTPLFSAEFAIRPFITQHFALTYAALIKWSADPDEHVRRLASEGIRPRLPWGKQLVQFRDDPEPIIELIARLKDDPSVYVRRSIANNLNDIAKDHPERVIRLCKDWSVNATDNCKWIVRHGCRGLLKQGEPAVFALLGFTEKPQFQVEKFELVKSRIKLGESLGFLLGLSTGSVIDQYWMIDYKIHHVKANKTRTSKVFKLRTIKMKTNAYIEIEKKHPFRLITTRKYYSGMHSIEVLINGKSMGAIDFDLAL